MYVCDDMELYNKIKVTDINVKQSAKLQNNLSWAVYICSLAIKDYGSIDLTNEFLSV